MIAIDTSVAIPLLVQTHAAHLSVTSWWDRREVSPAGHARFETYAVLTRLPADVRLAPTDAARLIRARFPTTLALSTKTVESQIDEWSGRGISGGAVYDALVAAAALEHGLTLATCDLRARSTYELLGVAVEYVH